MLLRCLFFISWQVGERAGRLRHILEISSSESGSAGHHDAQEVPKSPVKKLNGFNKMYEAATLRPSRTSLDVSTLRTASKSYNSKPKDEPEEDSFNWRENLIKMREQIKAVHDLPKIEVPEPIKYQKLGSASTPDLSLYSDKRWQPETSWEIRARYRSMKTEELYQSQLIKKSGYSWRDKVPEIQKPLKFSEVRSNVVTDVAFIGSSYVKEKPRRDVEAREEQEKWRLMTKVYRINSSWDVRTLVIRDNVRRAERVSEAPARPTMRLICREDCRLEDNPEAAFLCRRLSQLLHFFSFSWQPRLCHPGYDFRRELEKILAAGSVMETIMEVEEIPDLEEMTKTEVDINAGDIKSKMTGALADWALVKKKNPSEKPKQTLKVESKISVASSSGDWRSEIKKRERAKQQEKLNAMPLGMPDYREPEKLQVVDWREKLKKEAADDNPMNKWKKFDSGVKKTTRPPPQKPKPKPSKVPKEDPCTCNVGNCKVHSKFAFSLKSTAKKAPSDGAKTEEPLKRRSSVKKKTELPSSKSLKTEAEVKPPKLNTDHASRASSVAPEGQSDTTEVIKIINFVAIKVTTKNTSKKSKSTEELEKLPPPSEPPPPVPKDPSPSPMSSSQSPVSSPPPVKDPSPPPPPPVETPMEQSKILEPSPEPPAPSPPPEPEPSCVRVSAPSPPPSPVYQRKYFPNPEPAEPFRPAVRDYTPNLVKIKRAESDYCEQPPLLKRQFSSEVEVRPVRFTAMQDNCVKKALFVGDQYLGGNDMTEFKVIMSDSCAQIQNLMF